MKIKLFFILTLFVLLNKVYSINSNISIFEGNKLNLFLAEKSDKALKLGLYFDLEPGWKIYWVYPGESGLPPQITIKNKKLYENLIINWPIPEELYEENIKLSTRVYRDNIIIPIDLYFRNKNPIRDKLKFDIEYQICKEICIPIETRLEINIPSTNYFNKRNIDLYQKYKDKVPKDISLNKKYTLNYIKNTKNIIKVSLFKSPNLKVKKNEDLRVFLQGENLPIFRMKNKTINDQEINFNLISNDPLQDYQKKITAFFLVNNDAFYIKTNIVTDTDVIDVKKIVLLIAISLIAGFILNFMPCVLPVLGIKISNFLKQIEIKNNNTVQSASIYLSFGIIFTFFCLAIFTVTLRSIGSHVGWGMQFQEPSFLIFLIFILLIFLINLLGLFSFFPRKIFGKIINFRERFSKVGVFWSNFTTGIISTILATPCTAPFVGTAVSFALSQNYFFTFMIFISMGIGKSLPYFLFILKPNIINHFPKPGPWMNYFKYFFAALLLLTILWLGKITFNNLNNSYERQGNLENNWEEFSQIKLENYLNEDKLIVIDITADWCITCQVNKKTVFEDKDVLRLFKENDIVLMRADWTFPSNEILEFLKSHNKYGIPFNAFYSKNYKSGYLFKELLFKEAFLKKMEDLIN